MKKRTAFFLFLIVALLSAPAWATTLPSYTNAVANSAGVPLQATITVFAAGTTTASTIYSDASGTTAKDNPFSTDSLGRYTFYAATGLYDIKISGSNVTTYTIEDVALGLYGPDETLTKTETRYAYGSGYYSQHEWAFTIAPTAAATYGYYYGDFGTLTVPATNTFAIGGLYTRVSTQRNLGTGTVTVSYGHRYDTANYGPITTAYGLFYEWSNYSDPTYGAPSVTTVDLTHLKLNNTTLWSGGGAGTPPGAPAITTARLINGSVDNKINGVGTTLGPTIGTLDGLNLSYTNGAYGTITTSRYINLVAPSKSATATWTNHYGLYMADQTVSGATLNFSLYSAGTIASAPTSFRPPVALGLPSSAMTLENSQITFSINEGTNTLTITVKYSDGTVKTATVILS